MIFRIERSIIVFVTLAAKLASADISFTGGACTVTIDLPGSPPQTETFTHPGGSFGVSVADVTTIDAGEALAAVIPVASCEVFQSSNRPSMNGDGAAIVLFDTQGNSSGNVSYSDISADSVLEVFFEVTTDQSYRLDALANWTEDLPLFGGYAFVNLLDVTNGSVLAEVRLDLPPPDTANLGVFVQLTSGISYRLFAASHIDGSGQVPVGFSLSNLSEWSFTLTAIPEPSAFVMLLPVALFSFWRLRGCDGKQRTATTTPSSNLMARCNSFVRAAQRSVNGIGEDRVTDAAAGIRFSPPQTRSAG